jgi:hypothetical protein
VTDVLAVKFTVQVLIPLHAPPHPAKVAPAVGVAVSVTRVPVLKPALHTSPQSIPAGVLMTVPWPGASRVTVSTGKRPKLAVTEVLAVKFTVQVLIPLHAPPHPENVEFEEGVAVSVTRVPVLKPALHTCPQSIPAGVLTTEP